MEKRFDMPNYPKEILCNYPNIRQRRIKKKKISRYRKTLNDDKNL